MARSVAESVVVFPAEHTKADARERRGVVLAPTALLIMPDLPSHRAGQVWHLAYSHDARGRLTETVSRTMPQLLGLAVAADQE